MNLSRNLVREYIQNTKASFEFVSSQFFREPNGTYYVIIRPQGEGLLPQVIATVKDEESAELLVDALTNFFRE